MERNENERLSERCSEIQISKINKILAHSPSVNSMVLHSINLMQKEEEKIIPAAALTSDFLLDYIYANVFLSAYLGVRVCVFVGWQKNKMLACTLFECSFGIDAMFACTLKCSPSIAPLDLHTK